MGPSRPNNREVREACTRSITLATIFMAANRSYMTLQRPRHSSGQYWCASYALLAKITIPNQYNMSKAQKYSLPGRREPRSYCRVEQAHISYRTDQHCWSTEKRSLYLGGRGNRALEQASQYMRPHKLCIEFIHYDKRTKKKKNQIYRQWCLRLVKEKATLQSVH